MRKNPDFSKKILNTLAGKPALKVTDLRDEVVSHHPSVLSSGGDSHHPDRSTAHPSSGRRGGNAEAYAITRSIKNLAETGFIETIDSDQNEYVRLTQRGRQKLASLKLDNRNSLASTAWDGKWRIVLLDLPESRKAEREALRYLLKKAGFVMLKNSAWVSPFPFEFMFSNIKKDFELSSELMIIVTDSIDPETKEVLIKNFFEIG